MKTRQVTLYSIAVLPLLAFAFSQVPYWITGPEGRLMFSQLLTQFFAGIADAIITIFSNLFFGVTPA